jgi:hypothetical protein
MAYREMPVENKLVEALRDGENHPELLERVANELERMQRALQRINAMGPAHKGDKRWEIARDAFQYRPVVDLDVEPMRLIEGNDDV